MSPKPRYNRRRGVVDTSVLVAGVAGLKDPSVPVTPSARLLHDWIENDTFTWLVTSDIIDEYTEVLARLGVRRAVIGRIVNLLRAEAEFIKTTRTVAAEPDPGDAPFWTCAELGAADFIVTLNTKDFPQSRLSAKVIGPHEPLPSHRVRRRLAKSRRAR